jgi:hypothetical protein
VLSIEGFRGIEEFRNYSLLAALPIPCAAQLKAGFRLPVPLNDIVLLIQEFYKIKIGHSVSAYPLEPFSEPLVSAEQF